MIISMTGFGKAEATINRKRISVEIRSLNSKGTDIHARMPGLYREKELDIRNLVAEKLERGKIEINIAAESPEGHGIQINKAVLKDYYRQLKAIASELKADQSNLLASALRLPELYESEREELDAAEWKQTLKLIESAVKNLITFRIKEGKELEKDLRKRIDLILRFLLEVELGDKDRIASVREKLRKNVEELISRDKVDQNRFEQELIYYLEKLDITEEKIRLKTHCDFFLKTMDENSSGKKLGFISQEIGREINTIGSKANDAGIQKIVVQMKDELEKIKEQLNNIL